MTLDLSHVEPLRTDPYPFTDLQLKCLADLETTEEPQARGSLEKLHRAANSNMFIPTHEVLPGFCCLGRICVAAGATREVDGNCVEYHYKGTSGLGSLPRALAVDLHFKDDGGTFQKFVKIDDRLFKSLIGMNDHEFPCTFKEIAQYIRHDPWNVFLDPSTPQSLLNWDVTNIGVNKQPQSATIKVDHAD